MSYPQAEHKDLSTFASSNKPPAMDLYSGGGGSAIGARDHFDVRAAVDFDPVSSDTLK